MDENRENIQLLKQIANGSNTAFDRFYEDYVHFVFSIAFNIIGDQTEAEDVCHDVFLEVFQKPSQYDPTRGSVKAWLAIKTKSRALDRLRKKQPLLVNKLESLVTKQQTAVDTVFLSEIEKHLIIDALKHIPEKQREAIYRSYFHGETHQEIASFMEKPLGTVKSLIRYGLKNLRKQKALLNWIEPEQGGKHQ